MSKKLKELLTRNKKMVKSSGLYYIMNFTIPALQAADGTTTCPPAGACAKGCYAQQGAYLWSAAYKKHNYNFQATKQDDFIDRVVDEIKRKQAYKKGNLVVRIHDSGDFYNWVYLLKWIKIMKQLPSVKFYAYTKQVKLMKAYKHLLPSNFIVIFSEGGKLDSLIDVNNDRHARVFSSVEELEQAGYVNATDDDSVAFGSSNKIGLVYHGHKSKQWVTNKEVV